MYAIPLVFFLAMHEFHANPETIEVKMEVVVTEHGGAACILHIPYHAGIVDLITHRFLVESIRRENLVILRDGEPLLNYDTAVSAAQFSDAIVVANEGVWEHAIYLRNLKPGRYDACGSFGIRTWPKRPVDPRAVFVIQHCSWRVPAN